MVLLLIAFIVFLLLLPAVGCAVDASASGETQRDGRLDAACWLCTSLLTSYDLIAMAPRKVILTVTAELTRKFSAWSLK